ncbi:MAG TPA: GspL/Epsl periplasmic domain-containing protein, partial [Ramlibacter sp.]|nr:GspL/Epsl periplasmic domain-containing protein [Ramlibacter sp.]
RQPTIQQAPQRLLRSARSGWDLSQFDLASSGRTRALKKLAGGWGEILHGVAWRPARWGAALLVAINLVGLNAHAWKERASLEGKREAIRRALTTTFPHVKVVVDAPVQMEREVALLRQQTGTPSARDLDALLAALATALPPGRTPSAIEYVNGELRARGLALGQDEVRRVASQLKGLGLRASGDAAMLVVTAEDVR